MSQYQTFEYFFEDGTLATGVAVIAAHDAGVGVLIELNTPGLASIGKVKFVLDASNPQSLILADAWTNEKLIAHAIARFTDERWGDRLATRTNHASDFVYIEPMIGG